ncbi:hypothetical protein GQ43DRAFT_475287 [Delitschia confertaspora ATCC 74209]|uniref:Zinc finger PHD-type domain-containing protein n=1 Tax=Delitschia confertaspora ATCC 74209 TaxID=1513339 RepID=A0A9P4JDV0_9PLEO|nr:hypothetical protein GQ43DRAFT_475287 [Delitschia confertaspora ATCC 74209]
MSPRRSSRARTTQPVPNGPVHSGSSSSVSSGRTERATRNTHKQSSPQKSLTPHSLSSEDGDEPVGIPQIEPPLTRRRTREQDNGEDGTTKVEDDLDDDIAEEEEITRCVCGQLEYPGPPSDTGKSRDGQLPSVTDSDTQIDEAGGLFIQCDICKVWQHGGCVGIMDEATSPEEYFCEECRKDLHKLMISPKGQKYSRYLPVYEQNHGKNSRKGSLSKEVHKSPKDSKDRNARASVESFSKRRSTMNSRAAYDEDEVLRKVLEESKHEGAAAESVNGKSKKRNRDDSEETKPETKRQRTSSQSPAGSPAVESEDDIELDKMVLNKQKPRGAAARSQREKELRDKERERERAEAANRRKSRFERRKADELEPAEEQPPEAPPVPASASESTAAETALAELKPAPTQRKSGRPPQKRQSRLGRNQYTRDAPTPTQNGASPANNDIPDSPQVSVTNGAANDSSDGTGGTKTGKHKNWRLEKLSWNEIRRPAGAMQNYIAQRQVELAGDKTSTTSPTDVLAKVNRDQVQKVQEEEDELQKFKHLSTLEMMDYLSRDLVHWQQTFAEQLEK